MLNGYLKYLLLPIINSLRLTVKGQRRRKPYVGVWEEYESIKLGGWFIDDGQVRQGRHIWHQQQLIVVQFYFHRFLEWMDDRSVGSVDVTLVDSIERM